MSEEVTTIYSKAQFNYCPICGNEVEKHEVKIKKSKKNLEVKCSQHGILIIDKR